MTETSKISSEPSFSSVHLLILVGGTCGLFFLCEESLEFLREYGFTTAKERA